MSLASLVDKPLIDNPLAGGAITPPLTGGAITPPQPIGLQQPRPGMGLGFPGMKSLEEGMLFLPDKDNPRSEDEIQALYKQAQEEAAKQRREGFLGQVILPGEYSYEDFKATNLFGFKRNPNLPDSAYKDFDMTGVAGFTSNTPSTKPVTEPNPVLGSGLGDVIPNPGAGIADSFPGNPNRKPADPIQTGGLGDQGLMDRLTSLEQGIGSLQNQIASLFQTQQASDPFGLGGFINTRRY